MTTQTDLNFDTPFEEAVDWFLGKKIMSRPQFDRLAAAEKTRAFTAAYIYKADELQRVYDAVTGALEKGETLADFQQRLGDLLQPWHRETVFRTNVLSAYGRGHWEQAQAVKGQRPYARYSAVLDGHTRPSHAQLHGLVYPLDHPFWRLYWPPWDYNCRCGAITLSQGEIESQKLPVGREMPDLPPRKTTFVSPARGEDWQIDLSRYSPKVKQDIIEGLLSSYESKRFPGVDWSEWLVLQRRHIRQEDLDIWETMLWAREQGGVAGYPEWVSKVLERDYAKGEIYPIGNLPQREMEFLFERNISPRTALVVMDDKGLIHLTRSDKLKLSKAEVIGIPEKFVDSEWYWDREDPAMLMTWLKSGDAMIKVVIRTDYHLKRNVIANRVVSAGVVKPADIQGARKKYEKI